MKLERGLLMENCPGVNFKPLFSNPMAPVKNGCHFTSWVSFYGPYSRTPKCFWQICGQTIENRLWNCGYSGVGAPCQYTQHRWLSCTERPSCSTLHAGSLWLQGGVCVRLSCFHCALFQPLLLAHYSDCSKTSLAEHRCEMRPHSMAYCLVPRGEENLCRF